MQGPVQASLKVLENPEALAPLLVALALALAPGKMLLFGRLSGSVIKIFRKN